MLLEKNGSDRVDSSRIATKLVCKTTTASAKCNKWSTINKDMPHKNLCSAPDRGNQVGSRFLGILINETITFL